MGYKNECRKGLVIDSNVTIYFDGLEFKGKVVNYDNKNNNDYSVTINTKEMGRVAIPLSSGKAVICYTPSKELIQDEMELQKAEKGQVPGDVPK